MFPIDFCHIPVSIIKRSAGRSAVAAAAYRSGTKLTNEWDGMTHDYTRKGGIVHAEIMLPAHAPPEFADRSILWNSVEQIEKARDSQLAREIEAALPRELSGEQQLALVRAYVKDNFVDKGMCADFAIHDKGTGNPHVHIMLTLRPLKENGQWGAKCRKAYDLDENGQRINLAVILPDMLKSPLLTAEWETRLTEIAKGSDDPQSFMQGIEDMTRELVKRYSHITEDGKKLFAPEKEAVGICPRCKSPVYEGKKNFYCSDRSCRFVMWKNDKFFESRRTVFSKKIAAALLKDGKAKVKGLYSERTGKTYDGTVLLCDTGEKYVNYRIEQRK